MENTNHPSAPPLQGGESGNARDSTARIAGVLLILTAVATVVSVFARVSADTDQATLAESLVAIAENRGLYGAVSAVFAAVSGISAVALAAMAPTVTDPALIVPNVATETVDLVRRLAGKIGFAIAGLALLVAAWQQWKGGGKLRRLAPVSAIIGLAMPFIWIDSATFMHPTNGTGFVLWPVLIGSMLAGGFVERHFRAMRETQNKVAS